MHKRNTENEDSLEMLSNLQFFNKNTGPSKVKLKGYSYSIQVASNRKPSVTKYTPHSHHISKVSIDVKGNRVYECISYDFCPASSTDFMKPGVKSSETFQKAGPRAAPVT